MNEISGGAVSYPTKKKGYGGIETYSLVENDNIDEYIAVFNNLSEKEIQEIKNKCDILIKGLQISEESYKFLPSKETFYRARELNWLLNH